MTCAPDAVARGPDVASSSLVRSGSLDLQELKATLKQLQVAAAKANAEEDTQVSVVNDLFKMAKAAQAEAVKASAAADAQLQASITQVREAEETKRTKAKEKEAKAKLVRQNTKKKLEVEQSQHRAGATISQPQIV